MMVRLDLKFFVYFIKMGAVIAFISATVVMGYGFLHYNDPRLEVAKATSDILEAKIRLLEESNLELYQRLEKGEKS